MGAVIRSALTRHEIEEAYARFGPLVFLRCRRILREESAAEDALQETFVRLWRYGERFREVESKISWLYKVAERCCFDRLSQTKRRSEVPLAPEHDIGSTELEAIEDWNLVQRFLVTLDEKTRRVAVMHFIDEMTQAEIGAEMGWTRQTVAKKIRGIQKKASKARSQLTGARQRA